MLASAQWGGTGLNASVATVRQIFQCSAPGVFALTDSPEFIIASIVDASGDVGIELGTTTNGGLLTVYDISNGLPAIDVDGEQHAIILHSNTAITITLDGVTGQVIATLALLQSLEVKSLTGTTVPFLKLVDPDLSHVFTALTGTLSIIGADTAGMWFEGNTNNGGMNFAGFRSTGGAAITFQGHQSTTQTGPSIVFDGYKSNGAGGRTALTGTEIIAAFQAGAATVINVLADGTINVPSGAMTLASGASNAAQFDANATGGNTRMLLWDVTAGTMKRVSVGATDSGGVGFKLLRVPN